MRLLVTCRRDPVPATGEVRDAVDEKLVALLAGLGHEVHIAPNHPSNFRRMIATVRPEGLVLSGGNDVDPRLYSGRGPARNVSRDRDELELSALGHCRRLGLPVLGICRGLQVINVAFGGALSHDLGLRDGRPAHVATRHPVRLLEDFPVPAWRGRRATVNSFHNHGVAESDLARSLAPMAISPDGLIEGLRHRRLPIFAVQWHPERKGAPSALDRDLLRKIFGGKALRDAGGGRKTASSAGRAGGSGGRP
jgi:putative glutamine amidotransferase